MKRFGIVFALIMAALVAVVPMSFAGSKIWDANDSAFATFRGSVEVSNSGNIDPFVVQMFSSGGECLAVRVTSQTSDLEMHLISSTGQRWYDDDSFGSLRPRINAITSQRGWYTLILNHFAGSATAIDFIVQHGRFASNNSICSPVTSPTAADVHDSKAQTAPMAVFGDGPAVE